MAYKDKDKQREANRKAQAKFKAKGIINRPPSGITLPKETDLGNTLTTVQTVGTVIPEQFPKTTRIPTHKRGKDIKCFADLPLDVQLKINRMSLVDGKIDQTIKANRTAIAIDYDYQHKFPDRYYPQDATILSPVVTGKPRDADYNGICTPEWQAERGR